MKKRSKSRIFLQISVVIIGMIVLLVGVSLYTYKDDLKSDLKELNIVEHVFTKRVEQHRPVVTKYAKEYDVEAHVDVLLAMIMQESGGRGDDPMQSSESLCGSIGCIEKPEKSIEQGVAYFSQIMDLADHDVALSVQSYNFGIGFVDYVKKHNKTFNQELAISFSQEKYESAEDPSIYSCLREEAKQYDACYGDIYYARDVMAYKQKFAENK